MFKKRYENDFNFRSLAIYLRMLYERAKKYIHLYKNSDPAFSEYFTIENERKTRKIWEVFYVLFGSENNNLRFLQKYFFWFLFYTRNAFRETQNNDTFGLILH